MHTMLYCDLLFQGLLHQALETTPIQLQAWRCWYNSILQHIFLWHIGTYIVALHVDSIDLPLSPKLANILAHFKSGLKTNL